MLGLVLISKAELAALCLDCLGWAAMKRQGVSSVSWCRPCQELC